MHIHHTTEDGRALVSMKVEWQPIDPSSPRFPAEFMWQYGSDLWVAYRQRSGYGRSWWKVFKNGEDTHNTGELPGHFDVYVPIEVAREVK